MASSVERLRQRDLSGGLRGDLHRRDVIVDGAQYRLLQGLLVPPSS